MQLAAPGVVIRYHPEMASNPHINELVRTHDNELVLAYQCTKHVTTLYLGITKFFVLNIKIKIQKSYKNYSTA